MQSRRGAIHGVTQTHLSDQAGAAPTNTPTGEKSRQIVYFFAVLAAFYLGFVLQVAPALQCPASGYAEDAFLAYCQARGYADYDHGAAWFGLEPSVLEGARKADVLFIGNSRLEFGFSAPSLTRWFTERGIRYYLLGFTYGENITFFKPLLQRMKPHPHVYVINLDNDNFFSSVETPPGSDVMHAPDAFARYWMKKLWQIPHHLLAPHGAPGSYSYFRRRSDGAFSAVAPSVLSPVPDPLPVDEGALANSVAVGRDFLQSLGIEQSCIILTYVPSGNGNKRATAAAIAAALGPRFVSPIGPLQAFDGSHLDPASADRFVQAFLAEAGPQIEQCTQSASARSPSLP